MGNPTLISIHALLAESDYGRINDISRLMKISIHALLAESDLVFTARQAAIGVFLSTLSLRRATWPYLFIGDHHHISIHALLAESDPAGF